VLQTRDPTLDSDLAWSDVTVLASSLVAPTGGGIGAGGVLAEPAIAPSAATTIATVRDRLGRSIDLGGVVNLGGITVDPGGALRPAIDVSVIDLFDPAIWTASVTLPDTGGKPARVAVREYERYYTDRAVPEFRAGATRRRRVVEERLVYTAFLAL
jgi:hypothetical protein